MGNKFDKSILVADNKQGEFSKYSFDYLEYRLPKCDYLSICLKYNVGAINEKQISTILGKDVYGILHLVEHLSMLGMDKYKGEDVNAKLSKLGTLGIFTSYTNVMFSHTTTVTNYLASREILTDIFLNDLTGITKEEFEKEKEVVKNELLRYMNAGIQIFGLKAPARAFGLDPRNDIGGTTISIDSITMQDVIAVKKLLIHSRPTVNITCDYAGLLEILGAHDFAEYIQVRLLKARHGKSNPYDVNTDAKEFITDKYKDTSWHKQAVEDDKASYKFIPDNNFELLPVGEYRMKEYMHFTEEVFISDVYDITEINPLFLDYIKEYFYKLAGETSIYSKVRKNGGLTYGVNLNEWFIGGKTLLTALVDLKDMDKVPLYTKLFNEAINESLEKFNEEIHDEIIRKNTVISKLKQTSLLNGSGLLRLQDSHRELLADLVNYEPVDDVNNSIIELCDYDTIKAELGKFKDIINKGSIRLINKEVKKIKD